MIESIETKYCKIFVALAGICLIIGGTAKVISSIYKIPQLNLAFGISWVMAGMFFLIALYINKRHRS